LSFLKRKKDEKHLRLLKIDLKSPFLNGKKLITHPEISGFRQIISYYELDEQIAETGFRALFPVTLMIGVTD